MIKVTQRHPKEDAKSLFRRFRRLVEREGLMKDLKRIEFYEKPSDKRRVERKRRRRLARGKK